MSTSLLSSTHIYPSFIIHVHFISTRHYISLKYNPPLKSSEKGIMLVCIRKAMLVTIRGLCDSLVFVRDIRDLFVRDARKGEGARNI